MNADYYSLLTCKQVVELITGYQEGTLATADRTAVDRHLVVCGPCRIYLREMEQTVHLAGRLADERLEPERAQALLHLFRDWRLGREQ